MNNQHKINEIKRIKGQSQGYAQFLTDYNNQNSEATSIIYLDMLSPFCLMIVHENNSLFLFNPP